MSPHGRGGRCGCKQPTPVEDTVERILVMPAWRSTRQDMMGNVQDRDLILPRKITAWAGVIGGEREGRKPERETPGKKLGGEQPSHARRIVFTQHEGD